MKSTKTSISAPSLAATSTAEAPPRAAAPAFTMSRADACRKQQICKRLDNICIKVIFRSRAFTDVSHKFSRMCFKKKYKPYVDFDPEVNLAMLTITCEHEREKLEEVVKMQLEVARQARLLCSAEAKEKRLDAAYWKLVNKYKKG
ncbi:hypothetical protein GGP41_006542 [Bipolaris sorokiniana]|uniref:Uncharacterized protein n=1 Tax=Cochliobolus sativus TaxID=45130 RepID=A0A8H5ZRH7_COCSA|nr:hypothetical protein GGP41_006542 [Bipolaris sorokiniana]